MMNRNGISLRDQPLWLSSKTSWCSSNMSLALPKQVVLASCQAALWRSRSRWPRYLGKFLTYISALSCA